MKETNKSFVGDPVDWPGLVYSPLNNPGLIFALGAVAEKLGIIFEEFLDSGTTAICRRKTGRGWEKIRVSFAFRSSEFINDGGETDLMICWIDDSDDDGLPQRLELRSLPKKSSGAVQETSPGIASKELRDNIREDLLAGREARESFEETIRQLDNRIKKLKGS